MFKDRERNHNERNHNIVAGEVTQYLKENNFECSLDSSGLAICTNRETSIKFKPSDRAYEKVRRWAIGETQPDSPNQGSAFAQTLINLFSNN